MSNWDRYRTRGNSCPGSAAAPSDRAGRLFPVAPVARTRSYFRIVSVNRDRGEKGDDLSTFGKVLEFLLSTTTSFRRRRRLSLSFLSLSLLLVTSPTFMFEVRLSYVYEHNSDRDIDLTMMKADNSWAAYFPLARINRLEESTISMRKQLSRWIGLNRCVML